MILLLPHSEAQFCFFSNNLKVCMRLLQGLCHIFLKYELRNLYHLHPGVSCMRQGLGNSEIIGNLQYLLLSIGSENLAESGPLILIYILLVLLYCIPTRWEDKALIF